MKDIIGGENWSLAKQVAIEILRNSLKISGGAYQTEFGSATYSALITLITYGSEDYCKSNGHIKHADLPMCICCYEEI